MYEVQEYSAPSKRWYTICVSATKEVAEQELRFLSHKNGQNYRIFRKH